jgi:hypothetical protein
MGIRIRTGTGTYSMRNVIFLLFSSLLLDSDKFNYVTVENMSTGNNE